MTRREDWLRANIGVFLRQYGRVSRKSEHDPNDRRYARDFEREVKRLHPRDLDLLINGTGDEDVG